MQVFCFSCNTLHCHGSDTLHSLAILLSGCQRCSSVALAAVRMREEGKLMTSRRRGMG